MRMARRGRAQAYERWQNSHKEEAGADVVRDGADPDVAVLLQVLGGDDCRGKEGAVRRVMGGERAPGRCAGDPRPPAVPSWGGGCCPSPATPRSPAPSQSAMQFRLRLWRKRDWMERVCGESTRRHPPSCSGP